jgi:anthranilate phosphoribosyltransferase
MKEILKKLMAHQILNFEEAQYCMNEISEGRCSNEQIAAFLTCYLMRDIAVDEILGFKEAILSKALKFDLREDATDLCGTGGDGKNTFNISTLAAFVTAGAGVKVVKHGNYGVSSLCGSSNVLESLGYKFITKEQELKEQLDSENICFLHAPLFHPAMKAAAPVRRALGMKTFFNLLGPILNPAQPSHQLIGVFDPKVLRLYQYLHQQSDKKVCIVHTETGYDEVSLTAPFKMVNQNGEHFLDHRYFNSELLQEDEIFGGESIEEAKAIFKSVLSNEGTTGQNQVVLANAALAIANYLDCSIDEAKKRAEESLFSGKANQILLNLTN